MPWYVVFNGRKPGVYDSWYECKEQVHGFSNARFKKYQIPSLAEKAFRESLKHSTVSMKIQSQRKSVSDFCKGKVIKKPLWLK